MNTTATVPNILTPEFIAQLKKASDEGTFGKEKIENTQELIAKGLLEKLEAFMGEEKKAKNV